MDDNDNKKKGILGQITDTIGLPAELVNKAVSFMGQVISPAALEAGGILHDQIRSFRFKRQIIMLNQTKEYCISNNIEPKQVALKNIVPLLECGSLEQEESLQNLWTNLLIETVSSDENHEYTVSYIEVLKQLTPKDAKVLLFIQSWVKSSSYFSMSSPEFITELKLHTSVTKEQLHDMLHRKFFRMDLVYYILEDQGVISTEAIITELVKSLKSDTLDYFSLESHQPIQNNYEWITLSPFGRSFIEAVQDK